MAAVPMLRNELVHRDLQEINLGLKFQLGDGDMQQNYIVTQKFIDNINKGLLKNKCNMAKK